MHTGEGAGSMALKTAIPEADVAGDRCPHNGRRHYRQHPVPASAKVTTSAATGVASSA